MELLELPSLVKELKEDTLSLREDNQVLIEDNRLLRAELTGIRASLEAANKLTNKLIDYARSSHIGASASSSPNVNAPRFLEGSDYQLVVIGQTGVTATVQRVVYEDRLLLSTCGKQFVLKMLTELFTDEELASSNVNGGPTRTGTGVVTKRALKDEVRYNALIIQAEKEFPGDTSGYGGRVIRESVNNKCKKLGHKLFSQ